MASIDSLTIRGTVRDASGSSMLNSNASAYQIGRARLAYAKKDNGDVPFGLAAMRIGSAQYKDVSRANNWRYANLANPGELAYDDLIIRVV